MSIEIDSEQGVCSVEIEGSRHRAPVDSPVSYTHLRAHET
ncbi:DUF3203 family protein, partial [Pseudomonas aeruginosa]|nr:DUF3203 family protein [Pseudomonas aeruginosa]